MTSGSAAGHVGLFHAAAFYDSDEEFLDIVVPFLLEGLAAGEPAVVAFSESNAALVRGALPDPSRVTFIAAGEHYRRPAATIRSYRELINEQVANGAGRIRIAGDVPHPGVGVPWSGWARYEAAINRAFAEFPLSGLCPYDSRITPYDVVEDVGKTHPWLVTPGGRHVPNADFQDPAQFLDGRFDAQPDPLETAEPVIELTDPGPAVARVAVRAAALACGLAPDEVDELVTASQEAVVNALVHGKGPVRLRVWVGLRRTVVAVHDCGPGPADPFAGLLPASQSPHGGFGLWHVHQLCQQVTMSRDEHGFTIRLAAGPRFSRSTG